MKRNHLYLVTAILLLAAALILCVLPEQVMAAERKTYDVSKGDVVISKSGDYNLTGTTKENTVTVKKGVKTNIWITDLNIETSAWSERIPILIESKANVNLILAGTNILKNQGATSFDLENNPEGDAILLQTNAKLTISKYSAGTFTLYGGIYGNGIGGKGSVYVLGGNIKAYGGMYGAGIGNSLSPKDFKLYIRGGMVTAYGGLQMEEPEYMIFESLEVLTPEVYDISAGTFVITGGHVMVEDMYTKPVGEKGKTAERRLFNCDVGNVSKIMIGKTTYGSTGIISKGYLSLWSENDYEGEIVITYENKKTFKVEDGYIISDGYANDITLDLSKGTVEFVTDACIYANHVYHMYYWYNDAMITITGSAGENQLIINKPKTKLKFDSISADTTKSEAPFMILGNNAEAQIYMKGKNSFQVSEKNPAILAGYQANLQVTSGNENGSMEFKLDKNANGIIMEGGDISQYQGSIKVITPSGGCGIDVWSGGSYSLYGGTISGTSEKGMVVFVMPDAAVNIYGGTMTANNIGYGDQPNEEIYDSSLFLMTGGKVTVINRIMFGVFQIHGGEITAHLLGSGSGSKLYQYGGNIVMDLFITDHSPFTEYYGEQKDESFTYDPATGKITGSAINTKMLYGGTIKETGAVKEEEIRKITFWRS